MHPATTTSRTPTQHVEHRNICGVVEADCDLSAGTRSQVVDVFDSDDSAVADDRDGVAQVVDLVENVRRQEHSATFGHDFVHELVETLLHERVEPRGRFVEHEEFRPVKERLGQRDL